MSTEIQTIVPGILCHLFLKQSVPEEPENLEQDFHHPKQTKGNQRHPRHRHFGNIQ